MNPTDKLGQCLRENGGGWLQLWDAKHGFSVLVYRNGHDLHAGGHGATPTEAIVAALQQMGIEVEP